MKSLFFRATLLILLVTNCSLAPLFAKGAELPKVVIVATGGTIAGAADKSVTTQYKAGVLSVEQIVASAEGIDKIAQIETAQFLNIASQNLSSEKQLELAMFVTKTLGREDVTGVVVTHGTDTMEESAYLLSLLVSSAKPVVLVGAMRPSTSLSADGSANLYSAVVTAVSPQSRGRGAMVVMNDEVILARDVMKFNTIKTDAFRAPNSAPVGSVIDGKVEYLYPAMDRSSFDRIPKSVAKVAILYGHVDSDPKLVEFLVSQGYKGIVFAGVGHGNTNDATLSALAKAVKSGVAVVRASRVPTGVVTSQGEVDDETYGFTSSGRLNPAKARVLLSLALSEAKGNNSQALKIFDSMKY